jgi:hypothetical protein
MIGLLESNPSLHADTRLPASAGEVIYLAVRNLEEFRGPNARDTVTASLEAALCCA